MKTLRFVLLLSPLLLLAVTGPAAAGPATVSKIPQDCFVGWAGIDATNVVHTVLLSGTGILVESNNSGGNALLHCGTQIDFGATTVALDIFTLSPVTVRLLTIDEGCLGNPDACRGGGNGAVILTFGNTGIPCVPGGVPTTRYSERVTPSGQAQLTCHLPE
jgi:hypothetical protein